MIKEELKVFFTALLFYTRIPCPRWVDHSEAYLNKATRYFPLIGWIAGLLSSLVLYLSLGILPLSLAILLSTVAGILLTGAFHEDGFADVCDGFGGGWTKQKILDIMKDSRVGAYGVIGIIFMLAVKSFSLHELAQVDSIFCCKVLIAAHTLSRFSAISLKMTLPYVRENEDSKAKPIAKQTSLRDYCIALAFACIPLLLFKKIEIMILFIPLMIAVLYLRYYFKKWIGGYTGDCLGATQQLTEVVIYIFFLSAWKYI
jgi:adenosylcobinamide-GDP ribazoletransferase